MHKRLFKLLLILCFLMAPALAIRPANAQAETRLSLSPAEGSVPQDSTTTVRVEVSGGQNINAYDLTISYDPAVLALDSWEHGDYLSNLGEVVNQNQPGSLRLVYTQLATPGVSGDGTLLVLKFRGLSMGSALIEIQKARMSTSDSMPVIPAVSSAAMTVTDPLPTSTFTATVPPTRTATATRTATGTATRTATLAPTHTNTLVPYRTATNTSIPPVYRSSTPIPTRTSAYSPPGAPTGMATLASVPGGPAAAGVQGVQDDLVAPPLPQKRGAIPSAGQPDGGSPPAAAEAAAAWDAAGPGEQSDPEASLPLQEQPLEQNPLQEEIQDSGDLSLLNSLLWGALLLLAAVLLALFFLILRSRQKR